jgi:hypothetical protein
MSTEIRFSYNPFENDFIECDTSHTLALYNKGKQKQFDEYIRGIIHNGVLYLRTYYPFTVDNYEPQPNLKEKSRELLEYYLEAILKLIKNKYGIVPNEIKYNVVNDLLSGIGLANI